MVSERAVVSPVPQNPLDKAFLLQAKPTEANSTTRAEYKAFNDLENSSSRLPAPFDKNVFATEYLSFLTLK